MRTETLEKIDAEKSTDKPKVFHYIDKNAMVESVITGGLVEALCGKLFPVREVAKPGSPICPPCKEIFERVVE